MPGLSPRVATRTIHNVALAYFATPRGVGDAVRDLCTAGFDATHINISQPLTQQNETQESEDGAPLPSAIASHSLRWLWSRALAHDRHRRGADQIKGRNPVPEEGWNPTCSTFDLPVALTAMHVPAEVIRLLQLDAQNKGMFLLVDAEDRVEEADAILDGNAGYMRTQYLRVLPS